MPGECTRLAELDLDDNQLSILPDSIANLTGLTALEVTNNKLATLPDWLTNLPVSTTISAIGNPLVSPPPEISAGGSESIRTFIRARRQGSTAQWLSSYSSSARAA